MADNSDLDNLRDISKKVVSEVNAELADQLKALNSAIHTDLEDLRPKITDKDTYDKLIAAVEKATELNEDIASLIPRVKNLGEAGVSLLKKMAGLV
jgi:hypothetical protein